MPTRPNDGALLRRLLWSVALAYAAVGLVTMLLASPKVPYADPWRFLADFLETPFPANVLASDNGHREVLPNLVRVAELEWFDANQWLQIGVAMGLAVLTVIALLRSWRGIGRDLQAATAAVVCIGVFWLGNARKLAHGNESVHLFLVLGCLVAGLRLLARLPREGAAPRVWGAAAFGVCATLSFGSGVACFGAFGAVLLLQRAPWRQWVPLLVGAVAALAGLLLAGGGDEALYGFAPLVQIDLLLRWLGAPFVWILSPLLDPQHAARLPLDLLREPALAIANPVDRAFGPHLAARWPALLFGCFGLLELLIASLRQWRQPGGSGSGNERLALGLAWFGVGTGVLVVVARVAYFAVYPEQVTTQRYLPWSMMFWTGLLLAWVLREGRSARSAGLLVLGVAALLAPSQVWTGRNAWKQLHTAEQTALGAAVGVLDRQFELVETMSKDLLRAVPLLRAAKKSVFAWPETQLLGSQPGLADLTQVPVAEVVIVPVANWFGPDGCRVQFRAERATATRLVLLDATGLARGLAMRAGGAGLWSGWCTGTVGAAELRAVELR